ncbi:MAG: 5'/3'-nucleotidase SurE [Bacteriovoracaceae bacterium]|jgi:5'-nucleotidase|nr:5'/3'-nucleotidase SurE [Bacteriovoracaceae bacterium]
MNILLVNDDGVHAPGILNLFHQLRCEHRVIILAPLQERSATGHTLTLDNPLRLVEVGEDIYGLSGFPADCTLMGIAFLQKKLAINFDIVISGINRGANLGQDIFYSGTVAAAREAAFRGLPAIAISSCMDFHSQNNSENYYDTASILIKKILQLDVHREIPQYGILNINVPWCSLESIAGIRFTKLGFRHYSEDILERSDFRGKDYFWIGGVYRGFQPDPESDCQAIEDKLVSVGILKISDFSAELTLEKTKNDYTKLKQAIQRLQLI